MVGILINAFRKELNKKNPMGGYVDGESWVDIGI